jgi:hypothetical protein
LGARGPSATPLAATRGEEDNTVFRRLQHSAIIIAVFLIAAFVPRPPELRLPDPIDPSAIPPQIRAHIEDPVKENDNVTWHVFEQDGDGITVAATFDSKTPNNEVERLAFIGTDVPGDKQGNDWPLGGYSRIGKDRFTAAHRLSTAALMSTEGYYWAGGIAFDPSIATVKGVLSNGQSITAVPTNGFWHVLVKGPLTLGWVRFEALDRAGEVIWSRPGSY